MKRVLTRCLVWVVFSLFICFFIRPLAIAEDVSELRQDARNPVSSTVKLPFEQDTFFSTRVYHRVPASLQVQPVIPFHVSENWLLVPRIVSTIFAYQPDFDRKSGGTLGFGDTNPTFFLTPAHAGKVIWGVGPSILMPTATSPVLGFGKWGLGPSVVLLTQPAWGSVNVLVQNIWSIAGDPHRAQVNQLLFQYSLSYNLPRGWYLTTQPGSTADWRQPRSERWVVPFGAGVGKTFNIGKLGFDANAALYRIVVHPNGENTPNWQSAVQFTTLFPKKP